MLRVRLAALLLLLAPLCAAGVVETKAPQVPVLAPHVVPVSPAELAAHFLSAAAALPQANLPAAQVAALKAAVPQRPEPALPAVTASQASQAAELAKPVLQSLGAAAALGQDQSAAALNMLFDRFKAGGLVGDPSPGVDADAAAARTGLSPAQLKTLAEHSAAGKLLSVEQLLRDQPLTEGGYLLGATDRSVYHMLASATGLTHFAEVYHELYGKVLMDVTEQFLDFVTGSGLPVVFLLPPDALTHPKTVVTKQEIEWLLARPERLGSVRFVVGAYEFLGGEPEGVQRTLAEKALELWRGGSLSSDEKRLEQRELHRVKRGEAPYLRPQGEKRLAAIELFISDMRSASYGRDRHSSGRFFFQGSRGMGILRRAERGYFLEYSGTEGWTEIFVSKRSEPELYERLRRAYLDAS
jgi:hypothetical protein